MDSAKEQANLANEQVILELQAPYATIRLGNSQEGIVVLSQSRLESLSAAIKTIKENKEIKYLIIVGSNPNVFCAGADIKVIHSVEDPELGELLARRGQDIFGELEALNCVKVAAISGACVGGGCELVLACDYRILARNPQTKIGLPEIRLGILPGFGGTQRLPRLIGLKNALPIILQGKVLNAEKALKVGLADKLIDLEGKKSDRDVISYLEEVARKIADGTEKIGKRTKNVMDTIIDGTSLGRSIVQSRVIKSVEQETKGHYPAPFKAIDAIFKGLEQGMKEGLKIEARSLGELIASPESKSLVHLYFLTENASKLGRTAKDDVQAFRVGVIGGGTMGAGIACSFLSSGSKVTLVEVNDTTREAVRGKVEGMLSKRRSLSTEKRVEILNGLTTSDNLSAIAHCQLIVEAVPEDINLKAKILGETVKFLDASAIIATNTSSLSVTQIAQAIENPKRVIGIHFFNPAEKMPLVELVMGKETANKTIIMAAALISKMGKYPVVVEDVPGFLVNRILSPYLMEAAYLLKDGCSVSRIDAVATKFGMPMGPIRLLDEVGLDVASKVAEIMESGYGQRMSGPKYTAELVKLGRLGKKSGAGFYLHKSGEAKIDPKLREILNLGEEQDSISDETISNRLFMAMINEAVRCLDEGVAGQPGTDSAGQIDLATVMGTGFAPFKGGVIHYAQTIGAKKILEILKSLEKSAGSRFQPAEGILRRARAGENFC